LRRVVVAPEQAPAAPARWRIVDRLRLYRIRDWLHILPLPLATFDADVPLDAASIAALRGVVNAFAILAFGFLLNAVSDRHVDRDPRKNVLLAPDAPGYRGSLVALPALSLMPRRLARGPCSSLRCGA
jgi:hypothetical protein